MFLDGSRVDAPNADRSGSEAFISICMPSLAIIADLIAILGLVTQGWRTAATILGLASLIAAVGYLVAARAKTPTRQRTVAAVIFVGLIAAILGISNLTFGTTERASPIDNSQPPIPVTATSTSSPAPGTLTPGTRSATTSAPMAPAITSPVYLADMQPVTGTFVTGKFNVDGKIYDRSVGNGGVCPDNPEGTYQLDGNYQRFRAKLWVVDEFQESSTLTISLDGREIVRSASTGHPATIDIDVSQVTRMKLNAHSENSCVHVVLVEAQLQ